MPKTLRSKGVDFEVVLARAERKCLVTAIQLAMQILFGCRKKESLFLKPIKSDENSHLHSERPAIPPCFGLTRQ